MGGETDQPWLRGGSYLVARKIRMFLENWDRDYLGDQQNVIGRAKSSGAPLSGGTEFTAPDFAATDSPAHPAIPAKAHVRLASHEENDGLRILRRGYSYTDGIDPMRGTLLGGLLFLAYMKSPAQFIALQTGSGVTMRSTSTSRTSAARSSPAHRVCARSVLGRHAVRLISLDLVCEDLSVPGHG